MGRHIAQVFSSDIFNAFDLVQDLRGVIEHGYAFRRTNIRHTSSAHPDKVLSFTFVRVRSGDAPLVMILIQDVTENTQKTYQLSLLREISIAMQGVLNREKLLHLILTCVTAGFAIGFNRAFIFLVDDARQELRGYMGVGPRSPEEAGRVWSELAAQQFTFERYLENIHRGTLERSGLQDMIEGMRCDLKSVDNIHTETVTTGHYMHITNAWNNPKIDDCMKRFVAGEFVSIPLIARSQTIGVLVADNAYSGRAITPESIEVLTMFASQAGIAIENSRILRALEDKVQELQNAYLELEKTHDMLVRHERLAAIGELSARIAHEIRNPLATIGGFAKSIPKKYEDRERTIRNATIIVKEVARLENILTNILDFSKNSIPKKTLVDINTLVKETLLFIESDIVANNIILALSLSPETIEACIDPSQIKQVLLNVLKNGIHAMQDGGSIGLITRIDGANAIVEIHDTGKGIPAQYLNNIFEPFFTTRGNGTGLGLSISNRIVQNHQGTMAITSSEGEGTTVCITLPLHTEGLETIEGGIGHG
jgi:signal transduction histidine kinase